MENNAEAMSPVIEHELLQWGGTNKCCLQTRSLAWPAAILLFNLVLRARSIIPLLYVLYEILILISLYEHVIILICVV